jgi:hypothetical protein
MPEVNEPKASPMYDESSFLSLTNNLGISTIANFYEENMYQELIIYEIKKQTKSRHSQSWF